MMQVRALSGAPLFFGEKKMSADNGIYILKTRSSKPGFNHEYRLANLNCIECLLNNPQRLFSAFSNSAIHYDYQDLLKDAYSLDDKHMTEYGICVINEYDDLQWSQLYSLKIDIDDEQPISIN
jgi:hypothetical protein